MLLDTARRHGVWPNPWTPKRDSESGKIATVTWTMSQTRVCIKACSYSAIATAIFIATNGVYVIQY